MISLKRSIVRSLLIVAMLTTATTSAFADCWLYVDQWPGNQANGDGSVTLYASANGECDNYQPLNITLSQKDPNNNVLTYRSVTLAGNPTLETEHDMVVDVSPDGDYRAVGTLTQGNFHIGCYTFFTFSQLYRSHYTMTAIGNPQNTYTLDGDSYGFKCSHLQIRYSVTSVSGMSDEGFYYSIGPFPVTCLGHCFPGRSLPVAGPGGSPSASTADCG